MQLNQAIGQVESAMHELEELEAANICKPIERSVSRLKQKANPSTNMKKRLTAKGNAMPFDITKLSQPMNNLVSNNINYAAICWTNCHILRRSVS